MVNSKFQTSHFFFFLTSKKQNENIFMEMSLRLIVLSLLEVELNRTKEPEIVW